MGMIHRIAFNNFLERFPDAIPKGADQSDVTFVELEDGGSEIIFQTNGGRGSFCVTIGNEHASVVNNRQKRGLSGSVEISGEQHASLQLWKGAEIMCKGLVTKT